uniref:Ribonuclease L n=1 Tax=Pelodiscus sinensis TaxID=13735 RepID=K7FKJ9_PELSI|nr:2-5A-dependent ribonuclease [Pelodiscus sinensis]XP_025042367.1 2-5A-dependent ribonuclease [Pelodiscus sinensis]|eukprot:XP_006126992.1 2-5A-dependent ribonuclease [Pelodiscus sinensis]
MEATGNSQEEVTTSRNETAADKTSLLHSAVQNCSIETVRQLLEEGANVNAQVAGGWTPLHSAVQADKEEIVMLLLEHGADPLAKKKNGATPFIVAGIVGNKNLLQLFLSKGSEINECDDNGFTAFMEAAWYGNEEALKFLHREGADVNQKRMVNEEKMVLNKGGGTALMDAAREGHYSAVKILVDEMKADMDICDNNDRNALVHAFLRRDSKERESIASIALFLLDRGVDVNRRDEHGKTTLILAVEIQSLDLVKALLEKNEVDINDADREGNTALMIAVEKNYYEIAKLLCEKGARTDHGDLIQLASRKYNKKMADLLRQYGAKACPSQPQDWEPTSKRWGGQLKEFYNRYHPVIGKLKILTHNDFRIHRTSQGGIYLGFYDGKEVAVKIFKIGTEIANQEKTCLEECRTHNHFVNLLGVEEKKSCLYLCLSLCEKNLEEHLSAPDNEVDCKDVLKTVFEAVQKLHELGFGHQDLHPRNILIDAAGKVRLADFDKSKRLSDGQEEIIIKDLKGLRRLVLYVVTMGKVPFEDEDRPDLTLSCPEGVQDYVETVDLMESLISPDEGSPVENLLRDLIQHPFFWSKQIRYRFLRDVGNEEDFKPTKNRNNNSEILKALNCDQPHRLQQWTDQIDELVLDSMLNPNNNNKKNQNKNKNKTKKRYENSVTDLLRFIRNMGEHFAEKDDTVKEIIKEPSEYFLSRFPELTVYVYKALRSINDYRHFPSPQSLSQL